MNQLNGCVRCYLRRLSYFYKTAYCLLLLHEYDHHVQFPAAPDQVRSSTRHVFFRSRPTFFFFMHVKYSIHDLLFVRLISPLPLGKALLP